MSEVKESKPINTLIDSSKLQPETVNFLCEILEDQKKEQPNHTDTILLQEKLIITALKFFNENPGVELKMDFEKEVEDFVQKTNVISLSNWNSNNKVDRLMITRAFDLLFNFKHLKTYFKNKAKFVKLKVLTYNNLSCIYKQQGKYPLALKAITNALSLEEQLFEKDKNIKDIVETYLNRSAILTRMKRHDKAVNTLKKAISYINDIDKSQKSETEIQQIQQLEMYSYFNLGVQYEYLRQRQQTIENYEKSYNLAKESKHEVMKQKSFQALSNAKSIL